MGLIEETFRTLAVSLEESQRARERSYVEAVGAIVTAADARDQETTGHSFRVALYAVELARSGATTTGPTPHPPGRAGRLRLRPRRRSPHPPCPAAWLGLRGPCPRIRLPCWSLRPR